MDQFNSVSLTAFGPTDDHKLRVGLFRLATKMTLKTKFELIRYFSLSFKGLDGRLNETKSPGDDHFNWTS